VTHRNSARLMEERIARKLDKETEEAREANRGDCEGRKGETMKKKRATSKKNEEIAREKGQRVLACDCEDRTPRKNRGAFRVSEEELQ